MPELFTRPDPDQLLRQVEAQEQYQKRGRLKIFLGYASGVGKSFRMLDEGRRRRMRGEDVVVAAVQPISSPEVENLVCCSELIPPRIINGVPVLDVEAVLRRRPQVCLIDGLAYDNPPGALRSKRWQDVEELLKNGISVLATVNIQHVEGAKEDAEKITGKVVKETIPRSFVNTADEIELLDATPELCMTVTDSDRNGQGVSTVAQQLSELREVALLLAAEVVDHQLEEYLERQGVQHTWGVQERILVCITGHPNAAHMISSGRRNAGRFHGELFAIYISEPSATSAERAAVDTNLAMAREAGAQVIVLDGEEDAVDTTMRFAREHGITQIFLGHSTHEGWRSRFRRSFVERMIRAAEGIDIRVFPH